MYSEHDGITLWYGTADTPAPAETVPAGRPVSVTIAARPIDSSNQIELRYLVNDASETTVLATWLRTDPGHDAQYFRANLPAFQPGDTVDYAVVCRRAGRQVPSADDLDNSASSFRVVGAGLTGQEADQQRSPGRPPQPATSGQVTGSASSATDRPGTGLRGEELLRLDGLTTRSLAEIQASELTRTIQHDEGLTMGQMVTFQHSISYAGDLTQTDVKSVSVNVQVPIYQYVALSDSEEISRQSTAGSHSVTFVQPLDAKNYQVTLPESFVTGIDDTSIALSKRYFSNALGTGDVDGLTVTVSVVYQSNDGQPLGQQALEVLMLPKISRSKLAYFAINKARYSALRSKLANSSIRGDDAFLLRVLSYVTSLDDGVPTYLDGAAATVGQWEELQTSAGDAADILNTIKSAFDGLVDLPLTIPAIAKLVVAGELTIVAPSGTEVSPGDFSAFELVAEWTEVAGAPPRIVRMRFDNTVMVTGNTAPFSLTDGVVVYRNAVQGPVIVRVRGVDGSTVWSKEFQPEDPTLGTLHVRVPIQSPTTLTAPGTEPSDASLKLRGRVVTFNEDCVLKDVLVLARAKIASDAPWRVVGAATTDASGNFGMPYPYGMYVQAEAVVSLAPTEAVEVPIVASEGKMTISGDFLYLLVNNPDCPDPSGQQECGCSSTGKPNRLPDFSDLIGSDEYSQDVGGSCVNLSKPNRTINEFNFQAIVRISDPDVATYSITRHETGLDSIDVSLVASLASGTMVLRIAASTARTDAANSYSGNPTVAAGYYLIAVESAWAHVVAIDAALARGGPPITMSVLASVRSHVESVIAILLANKNLLESNDLGIFPAEGLKVIDAAQNLRALVALGIDTAGTSVHYELTGGSVTRSRHPIGLDNPVEWQDAPESPAPLKMLTASSLVSHAMPVSAQGSVKRQGVAYLQKEPEAVPGAGASASFSQAVSVSMGHILHYKALFKADGYSLGDLIYSLPLAPGQKKQIVVFDSSQSLVGAENQALSQNERLAMGLVDEREITSQLAGNIAESLTGSSSARTSGISAGFGTGGQGYGGTGAYGGSGSAVLGIAGGTARASSSANQDSSRDVAQFFGEKLRQSVMQNAEGYRQLNASVVTTVQQGQRYGVTSEVVANHNHCHALTMMYFEVLRHYAIFQELSSVEECVFVPLLLTRFTTENVAKWRDVLAPALLPMPSDTYLQPFVEMAGVGRQHPLIKAFDADQRLRTNYANVDYPEGSYDNEPIRFMKGTLLLRIDLPRPKTRYDRIKSLPVVTKTVATQEFDPQATVKQAGIDAFLAGATGGLSTLFTGPPGSNIQYQTKETQVQVRGAIFDAFMTLDANYESVPPAQCIRVTNFSPNSISFGGVTVPVSGLNFFHDGNVDQALWQHYATLLGYSDVLKMLDYYFKGRLISEWDDIFYNDIAPLIFRKIVTSLGLQEFSTDFTAETAYTGGERLIPLYVSGTTTKRRNQLPPQLFLSVNSANVRALADGVTLNIESVRLEYSTAHYNGLLYSGNVNNDLLDGVQLDIPENPDEKRSPRREDRYLAAKLIEHLNSNLEYYNKALWNQLDPDRRYMLLDGFSIQVFNDNGTPISGPAGLRSVASVVKNDVIAVAGNSLVFPVAPGYRVSGSFIQKESDEGATVSLFDHYKPLTPIEPYRISVPSRGVFAEAVQGVCNACEKIEADRLQDWSRFPTGDEPTGIAPVTVPTPTVTDWRAAFKDFAAPIVNVQNAPAAPAPGAGLQGLSELLGQSGIFKDITGLDANQQNAIRTYLSNQENAKAFAEMAKEMAMQSHNTQNTGKIMDSITAAKNSGSVSQQEAGQLVKDHLQQQIDGGSAKKAQDENEAKEAATPLSQAAITAASQGKDVTASRLDSAGNSESVSISGPQTSRVLAEVVGTVPRLQQSKQKDCWAVAAAIMIGWCWKLPAITAAEAATTGGRAYLEMYDNDTGLFAEDQDDFLLHCEMESEAPASYSLQQYIDWMRTYGPLWVTIDAGPDAEFSPHALVLTRIAGTGTPDGAGTYVTYINPASGAEVTQSFAEFIRAYEQLAFEDPAPNLRPQVIHFIARVDVPTGYQFQFKGAGLIKIHEPIHENITLAALTASSVPVPAGTTVGSDPGVNEFFRGVIWNDDPAVLLFNENTTSNWKFLAGQAWLNQFNAAKKATTNDLTNLTGRSHFFDLQFLHAMATEAGEQPQDTLAKILLWAEVMYRLSIGEGIAGTDLLSSVPVTRTVTAVDGTTNSYRLSRFFDARTAPTGDAMLDGLLTRRTLFVGANLGRRAIGSLLHVVHDSYAKGHVRRTLLNPNDLQPGSTNQFKPGTWGRYGAVETFHCYRGQDEKLHEKYDVASGTDAAKLSSFNSLIGARDAIEVSRRLLDMWQARTAWAAAGGPKAYLEGTVFKLAANPTPADNSVLAPGEKP